MKLKLICLFLLSNAWVFAGHCGCCSGTQIGTAGAGSINDPSSWYSIDTHGYPIPVLLSKFRDRGTTQGNVKLTPTGLKVCCTGNYWATFRVTVIFTEIEPDYTLLLTMFVIRNDIFDPTDPLILGTANNIPPNEVLTIQGSGLLENVVRGTTLSIIANNGGSPDPEPVTIISWELELFQIPSDD